MAHYKQYCAVHDVMVRQCRCPGGEKSFVACPQNGTCEGKLKRIAEKEKLKPRQEEWWGVAPADDLSEWETCTSKEQALEYISDSRYAAYSDHKLVLIQITVIPQRGEDEPIK